MMNKVYMENAFTQGGVNVYNFPEQNPPKMWCLSNNNGYIGWMGMGGSVFQWHPELKIGFGFNPFTHNHLDGNCYRGSRMQKIVVEIVKGTWKEPEKKTTTC